MEALNGTGLIVPEPAWNLLFSDPLEVASAAEYWRVITTDLRDRSILAPANAHAIERLAIAYVLHDRCARQVAADGPVIKPLTRRGIARLSPTFTAMREMESDALRLEQDLCITPRRRGSAGKVERRKPGQRPADAYLRPIDPTS